MGTIANLPSVVLICHEDEPLDSEGLAAWLAHCCRLSGIVLLRERSDTRWRRLRREWRRVGLLRLLDVILFRLYYRLFQAGEDARWAAQQVAELRGRYPAELGDVPRLVVDDPNAAQVQSFMAGLEPDLALARCKHILKPAVFEIPRCGTVVLHPGITPRYRNAHGCFWALANRDLANVGMTLLTVDAGIDTGPVYLQASYPFDERRESHIVIQHRVVLENLDRIGEVLHALHRGTATPFRPALRDSRNWGQPWLTAYLRWKRSARAAGA